MDTASTPYRVHQCSMCQGDTDYCCISCKCDLCNPCKENHVKDLKTIDHNVVSYHDKTNYLPKQEICLKNLSNVYTKYPKHLHSGAFYETKQQQHRKTIHTIRSHALIYRPALLPGIKTDFKTCRSEFSNCQSEMLTKAQELKDVIHYIQNDFLKNVFCDFDFKHRCLKQKMEINRHIVSLQRYIRRYEQRVIRPLQFLSSKKTSFLQIHLKLHTNQVSMTDSFNKEDVAESLGAIKITERGNRRIGNDSLMKMLYCAELKQSFTLTGVGYCYHISCVNLDQVWISDRENLILTNTSGALLHRVEDSRSGLFSERGFHTVNSENELIYIDRNDNINKLSNDMKTTTTFIVTTDSAWVPLCVYWSPSTGDVLVGMFNKSIGKVTRYNQSGQLTQTIRSDNTVQVLYRGPNFITENNNGDLVVSDFDCFNMTGAVVVTERGGRHRFSYTGPPTGGGLEPRGICTDALSHILVCDYKNNTVQIINKNGQFLSHILTEPQEMGILYSLSFDINTYRLWVGLIYNNKVYVYRYITRHDALKDQSRMMESLNGIKTTKTEKPHQGNQCLTKQMFSPNLLHTITVTCVGHCQHISCVTSDRIWVSDDKNNLILTDTTGVPLHRVEDVCSDLFRNVCLGKLCTNSYGLHTVNSESELFYIDSNYNIKKLSNGMKTTTTFVETEYSSWRPQCVYCSTFTGDILVAMCYINTCIRTGKVTRYNQGGQVTQTIIHDSTGRGLYNSPNFITENNNGDIVVSDNNSIFWSGAVVVTERGGRHRFSYTGHPSKSGLRPHGICTDALSHILVCDCKTKTVQMIDRDGQFLSHLLTDSEEMDGLYGLSFDVNTHCLWVGCCNKVCGYRYIDRQDALTDKHTYSPDEDALSFSTAAVEWI